MGAMTPLAITWIWPDTPIALAVIGLIAVVSNWLIRRGIRMATKSAIARAKARREQPDSRASRLLTMPSGSSERHEQRTATVGSLLRNLTSIVVWSLAVLLVLSVLGVPLEPLLASAGIGGVALAFGAQSVIKDFLSGVFMIMEDQYGVGDMIDTGEVSGAVEEVGLRVTRLRDLTGTVWYVRNGEILRVGNHSQGWSTAIVDVPVANDADLGKVVRILQEVATKADSDPEFAELLIETPMVAGVERVTAVATTVRMVAKTVPNEHWGVQRALLERCVSALTSAGVQIPSSAGVATA